MSTVAATSSNSILNSYLTTQAQQQAANTAATTAASSGSSTSSTADAVGIAATGNFNTYLNILTTQLQNQDPTDATDPNQFTQELVEFSGVEQQIDTNDKLTTLINLGQNSGGTTAALGYMGQYVQASTTTDQLSLQNSSAEVGYTLATAGTSADVYVKDASGNTIATLPGSATAGTNFVTWNGLSDSGTQEPDGAYTFSVSATNADGTTQAPTTTYILGKVTGVSSNSDGTNNLAIGNLSVLTSAVSAIYSSGNLPSATTVTSNTSS